MATKLEYLQHDIESSESHMTSTSSETRSKHCAVVKQPNELQTTPVSDLNSKDLAENIVNPHILTNESVSLTQNQDSTFQLNINFRESSYRGNVDIQSWFISATDILLILTGRQLPDKRVRSEYEIRMQNENKELHIAITSTFQAKKSLLPKVEKIELLLLQVDRTMIKTDIQILKKKMDTLLAENEVIKKKIKYSIGYYDPSIRPIDPRFYFCVKQVNDRDRIQITIELSDANPEFIAWIKKKERFQKIMSLFTFQSEHKCTANFVFLLSKLQPDEKTLDFMNQWILRWDNSHNSLSLVSNWHYREIIEYIQIRDSRPEFECKKMVDSVLLDVFELNLEFELRDKNLLPPSPIDPVFKCIPRQNTNNQFDLMATLCVGKANDVFFNPCIGFYSTRY
jgi:hypothetical protein